MCFTKRNKPQNKEKSFPNVFRESSDARDAGYWFNRVPVTQVRSGAAGRSPLASKADNARISLLPTGCSFFYVQPCFLMFRKQGSFSDLPQHSLTVAKRWINNRTETPKKFFRCRSRVHVCLCSYKDRGPYTRSLVTHAPKCGEGARR